MLYKNDEIDQRSISVRVDGINTSLPYVLSAFDLSDSRASISVQLHYTRVFLVPI